MHTSLRTGAAIACVLALVVTTTSCDQILPKKNECDLGVQDGLDAPRTLEARLSWIWQASEPASSNCRAIFLVGVDYWHKGKGIGNDDPLLDSLNVKPPPISIYLTATTLASPFAAPELRKKTIDDIVGTGEGFEECTSRNIQGGYWIGCFVREGDDPGAVKNGDQGQPLQFEIDVYWKGTRGIDYLPEAVVDIDARMYYEGFYED